MPGITNPEHSPEYWKPRMQRGPDDWPTPNETNDDDKILTAVFEALRTHSVSAKPNPEYPHVHNFRLLIESDIPDAADQLTSGAASQASATSTNAANPTSSFSDVALSRNSIGTPTEKS